MTLTSPSARSETGLAAHRRRGHLGGLALAVPAFLSAASAQTETPLGETGWVSPTNGGPSDVVSAS
jgi:hypothetical protein